MKIIARVSWQYTHSLNSKSKVERVKYGTYWGLIRHTVRHRGPQLAVVRFDGNKRVSKVPLAELKQIETEEAA